MLINLSDVLQVEGKKLEVEVPFNEELFHTRFGELPVKEVSESRITAAYRQNDQAYLQGYLRMVFESVCDRCLEPVSCSLDFSFERLVNSPEFEITEPDDEDGREFMDGYTLDVDALMISEIAVNWPVKILCREDCKGLCPVCGKNRNEGDCGCDTFVPDPRMAVLSDLFPSDKEV